MQMMYMERSSPNSPQFLGRADHTMFKREIHSSPVKKISKRRLSDDFQQPKKTKVFQYTTNSSLTKKHDYPEFRLPEGDIIQQTPYGNIRISEVNNRQISVIDKSITLDSFKDSTPPAPTTPKLAAKCLPSPSPSCEVETYMVEGYREEGYSVNSSYNQHSENIVSANYSLYDQHNEDNHLIDSDNDLDMC